jgi:hypothetical protein
VSDLDTGDVTAGFRLAYDAAIRRCEVCERCGQAPVSKALRIKGTPPRLSFRIIADRIASPRLGKRKEAA